MSLSVCAAEDSSSLGQCYVLDESVGLPVPSRVHQATVYNSKLKVLRGIYTMAKENPFGGNELFSISLRMLHSLVCTSPKTMVVLRWFLACDGFTSSSGDKNNSPIWPSTKKGYTEEKWLLWVNPFKVNGQRGIGKVESWTQTEK